MRVLCVRPCVMWSTEKGGGSGGSGRGTRRIFGTIFTEIKCIFSPSDKFLLLKSILTS